MGFCLRRVAFSWFRGRNMLVRQRPACRFGEPLAVHARFTKQSQVDAFIPVIEYNVGLRG